MKKIFGFTLSEILLSLAIIGVVAVLTLPMFIQNHQKQVYVTQLKETYSLLSQAFQKVIADTGAPTITESGVFRDGGKNFLSNYLKVTEFCESGNYTKCIDFNEYKRIDGSNVEDYTSGLDSFVCANLVNGSSLCMLTAFDDRTIMTRDYDYVGNYSYTTIFIDVNGKKKPNVAGRDLFAIGVDPEGNMVVHQIVGFMHNSQSINEFNAFPKIRDAGWKMEY